MSEINLDHYKIWVSQRTYKELNDEKITLGNLISDTAKRLQSLSGEEPEMLEKVVGELKELRQKLSIVINQLQKMRDLN